MLRRRFVGEPTSLPLLLACDVLAACKDVRALATKAVNMALRQGGPRSDADAVRSEQPPPLHLSQNDYGATRNVGLSWGLRP